MTSLGEHRLDSPGLHDQLLRFIVVGVVCTGIDAAVMWLLVQSGCLPSLAKAISYVIGMTVGFLANKFWTFRSQGRGWREPMLFIILYGVSMIANVAMNTGLLALSLHADASEPRRCFAIAFIGATATSTLLNFVGSRLYVFRATHAQ